MTDPFSEALLKSGLTKEQVAYVTRLLATPLRSTPLSMSVAALLEDLREEMRAMSSKWLNRERSARYLCTSESTIDAAAGAGLLRKHYLFGTPLYRKEDLDGLVTDGKRKIPHVEKEMAA